MKIKIALVDDDRSYLERIVNVFNSRYMENLLIYSYTDLQLAYEQLEIKKIDVLIVSERFEIEVEKVPQNCGIAYFVDSHDINIWKEQAAICKFQKIDLIYKEILNVYSEKAANFSAIRANSDDCRIYAFTSPCGGVGTSTVAAAFSVACAKRGRKVLYLNMEVFGSADVFFRAEGQLDMSDIIYALKSKKSNVALKIESALKQDATSGVNYFSASKIALDMMELNEEEKMTLLGILQSSGKFDLIVVDIAMGLDRSTIELLKKMDKIILVSDGTAASNTKVYRLNAAMNVLRESGDHMPPMYIVYNQYSNYIGRVLESVEFEMLGGAPRYEHATEQQVIEQLSQMAFMEQMM